MNFADNGIGLIIDARFSSQGGTGFFLAAELNVTAIPVRIINIILFIMIYDDVIYKNNRFSTAKNQKAEVI